MGNLNVSAKNLKRDIEQVLKDKINLKSEKKTSFSFNDSKRKSLISSVSKGVISLKKSIWADLNLTLNEDDKKNVFELLKIINEIEKLIIDNELENALIELDKIQKIQIKMNSIKFNQPFDFPVEIKENMKADLDELEKTYNSACYRSSIIICGRLLETSLHRKLYEKTGQDILERHPEIGLGKIIAKLEELNVKLAPGLTQQIHLINQARIHSVHKKKEAFLPSRNQAHAVILFTIDILRKLF